MKKRAWVLIVAGVMVLGLTVPTILHVLLHFGWDVFQTADPFAVPCLGVALVVTGVVMLVWNRGTPPDTGSSRP
jgi:uncharacterized membrane protein YdcZ (DUF606 family)